MLPEFQDLGDNISLDSLGPHRFSMLLRPAHSVNKKPNFRVLSQRIQIDYCSLTKPRKVTFFGSEIPYTILLFCKNLIPKRLCKTFIFLLVLYILRSKQYPIKTNATILEIELDIDSFLFRIKRFRPGRKNKDSKSLILCLCF